MLDRQPLHGVLYVAPVGGAQLAPCGLDGIDDHVGTVEQYTTQRQDQPRRNDEFQSLCPWLGWLGSGIHARR
jgi:hypothetical protein